MKSNRFDWTPTDMAHPIPVILDGDPGHDDALAWMIAAESPLIDIKAITTVAGNKDIRNVTTNALHICSLYGITAPIAQGARGPLVVPGYGCTCKELAEKVVASPQDYSLKHCGVHIEIQPGSPACGKMICDLDSDQKFEKKNAYLVM